MLMQLMTSNPKFQQIRTLYQQVKMSQNPQAMLGQIAQTNPQLKQAIEMAGSDPKTAFYSLAKQKGIDPEQIIQLLK
jgi:ABC-type antimicrobial peptide transport system ATPase subunit